MKKRLMAFLLVLVMVIGMLPLNAFADGGNTSGDSGTTDSGYTNNPGWWAFGNFVRLAVTRFEGADGTSGIFDTNAAANINDAQGKFNSALKSATRESIIIDIVAEDDWATVKSYKPIVTDNTAIDYLCGGSKNSSSRTPSQVAGDYYKLSENHYMVSAATWKRNVSGSQQSFYVGVNGNRVTTVNEFVAGNDLSIYQSFLSGNDESITADDIATQFNSGNSIFYHLNKFFEAVGWNVYKNDKDKVPSYTSDMNLFARVFHSAGPEDDANNYFYLMSFEPGTMLVHNPTGNAGALVYSDGIPMVTVRDAVNGKFTGKTSKIAKTYYSGMFLDSGMPVAHWFDNSGNNITAKYDTLWAAMTEATANATRGQAASVLNEKGAGLWLVSGYDGSTPPTKSVGVTKSFMTNFPDEYVSSVFGSGADSLTWPYTVTISGLDNGQTVGVYTDSDDIGSGKFDYTVTATGGSVTLTGDWSSGDGLYFDYYDTKADAIAGYGITKGSYIEVTETLSDDYVANGMTAVAYAGASPFGYRDISGVKSRLYGKNAKYDALQNMDTMTPDGYDIMGDDGVVKAGAAVNGSTSLTVQNMWVGLSVTKQVDGTYTGSDIGKTNYDACKAQAATESGKAFYDKYNDYMNVFLGELYFCGYTANADAAGWCSNFPNGTWASVSTSEHTAMYVFDPSVGSSFERYTTTDLTGLTNGAYVYPVMPVGVECVIVDPAWALHTFIASLVGGYGSFSVGEPKSTFGWLSAEYGGSDKSDATSYQFKINNEFKSDVSGYNKPMWNEYNMGTQLAATDGKTLDEYMAASSSWFDYDGWKAKIDSVDPDGKNEPAMSACAPFPVDLFGAFYLEKENPPVLYKSTITNSFSTQDGDCHVIVDLNMNEKPLYEVTTASGSYNRIEAAADLVDCGGFSDGMTLNLTDLNNAIMKLSYPINVKANDGTNIQVVAKPKGLYTAASGGAPLSGNDLTSYKLVKPEGSDAKDAHEHVLFVQWDFTANTSGSTGGGGGGSTGGTGGGSDDIKNSEVHTIYWDYGYTGAGVTSSQLGIETYYATQTLEVGWSISCGFGGAHSQVNKVGVIKYKPYIISYELDVPAYPERVGWAFCGWLNVGSGEGGLTNPNAYNCTNADHSTKFKNLNRLIGHHANNLNVLKDMGIFNKDHGLVWSQRADNLIDDYSVLGKKIAEAKQSGDASKLDGITFRAIWTSMAVIWHSMGGTFVDRHDYSSDAAKSADCFFENGQTGDTKGFAGVTNKDNDSCGGVNGVPHGHYSSGQNGAHTKTEIQSGPYVYDDCETYIWNGYQTSENEFIPIASAPVRTGYTFTGWFFDPYCSVPLNEFETGIQPRRHYYAGWSAEDVVINYYDTREGTQLLGQQTVKYGDKVNLLKAVNSTAGWTSVGWTLSPDGGEVLSPADTEEWRYNPGFAYGKRVDYPSGPDYLEFCNAIYYDSTGNAYDDSAHSGTWDDRGHWEVNLYADYDIKTTSYTVNIHWDDFSNNDGCRPQSVTVGLVTSVGNTVQETAVMTGPSDADEWTYTFRDLPITVSDSNTDIINYSFCVLSYVDANGNECEVKDTQASSGDMLVTTPTDHSTDPTSAYHYAISFYQDDSNHYFTSSEDAPTMLSDEGLSTIGTSDNAVNSSENPYWSIYTPYSGTLYMTHDLILTGDDIIFTIEWDDDSNRDGMRPEYVMLYLYAKDDNGGFSLITTDTTAGSYQNGTVAVTEAMCQVSDDGNTWVYTFEDYQKYTNQGQLVIYGFQVGTNSVKNYSVLYMDGTTSGPDTNGVKLTYAPKTSTVPVVINWHDNNNQDGLRPESVNVDLIAYQWNSQIGEYETVVVDSKTVTGNSTSSVWTSSFPNMYVYHDGMPVTYRLAVTSDLNGNIDDDSNGYSWTEGMVGNFYLDGAKPSVDIYHNVDERSVTATIQWADDNNNDGFRPESVILQLYANGEAVSGEDYRVLLTGDPTATTWSYTFEHLDIYTDGKSGEEVVYTIRVMNSQGGELGDYTASYINATGKFVDSFVASTEPYVLLTYTNKVDTVNGAIYWEDDNNRDGERPDFVDISLMARVYDETTRAWIEYAVANQTVTPDTDARNTMTASEWYFEFQDMPIYRDAYPITYYLVVKSDLNGNTGETAKEYNWREKYRGNMADEDNLEVSVTIYQGVEVLGVTATVEWDDDNNNDNLRPNAIILQLFADGVRVEGEAYTVTLYGDPTADTWTHTFENLPRYEDGDSGDEITYTVYAAEMTEGSLYGQYDEVATDGTTHTFTKYVASYPTAVDGQYSEELADSVESYVRLTHKNNEIEVPISIIWQDENNRDGQRPEYVSVQLMAYQWNDNLYTWEYKEVATKTIPYDDVNTMTASEWTDTFGLREMYHDGVKVIYHLAVTSDLNEFIPEGSFEYGWIESAYGNQLDAIPQVIISQNTNTVSVPATIYWDDSENNDNIRPTNVILQLYAHAPGEAPVAVDGQAYRVNLTGDPTADNWYYTFSGVPKYASGQSGVELVYTVKVIEVDGEPLYGYYIITANGEEEEVLRYEASYLHEDPDGQTADGNTVSTLNFEESDRAYVKLSHISETKTMNFSVNWHDDDNRDNVRPDSISVDLYKTVGNGSPIYLQTLVITEGANKTWTYKVKNLPGYEDGQPVKYTIEIPEDVAAELAAGGYTTTTQDNIVHLYYTPKTGSISTQLYWVDNEDNDGYRPDSVIAVLYANGVSTGHSIDLNETNNWSGTWTDLNVNYVDGTQCGTPVVYSVVIDAPDAYTVTYNPESTTIEENEVLYIQVSHVADVADVPVTVYWNDNSDNDGKRPEQLKVMLLVDGEESYYTAVLTADNATTGSSNIWTYTFENLPVFRGDGEKIYYSVIVYDDATWEGDYKSLTAGTTLYLSHAQAMSDLYVSFQFNDDNNADGERMTGLYLQLTADGVPVDTSEYKHTVSFDSNVDGYKWDFGALPVYKTDGTKIKYNVIVTFDPEFGSTDYTVWTSSDIELSESSDAAVNQIIVRLSKTADTTTRTGYIYWFDCNNLFGQRPDELQLALKNNYSDTSVPYVLNATTGEVTNRATGEVVGTVTVDEWTGDASVWTYTISGLPENYINTAGKSAPIYYYVTANTTSIAMYYPTVYTGMDYGMDVALTHRYYEQYCETAAQDYTVTLMWLDNSNAWGYRPDSNGVKLNLMANGELYDTLYLTSANAVKGNNNAWTYTFKDLPTYRGGAGIVWTVEAADVTAYTQEQTVSTAAATTLTYYQSVGFDFKVNWNDSDNDDAVRPANVVLNVFGDGKQVGSVTMTGTGNTWTGDIADLPVWRESDADAAVQYTFLWDDATAQYLTDTGYTAAPTLNGSDVAASQFYYLSASTFGDNTDTGYDVLHGTYDWETTLSYNKEVADYYFTVTFVDDVDRDGIRPDTVNVNLLADGKVIDTRELDVNAVDSMYTLTWEDLEVNDAGKPIVYTMELAEVPNGYDAEYNSQHTGVTLTHEVNLVDVTGTVNWDDSTELKDVLNPNGDYVRSYEQISRVGVYVQLMADGEPFGEPVFISADSYGEGENLNRSASTTWTDLFKYHDNGTEIVYTMEVYSDELSAILDDGHSMAYDFDTKYAPAVTITHDLYDIRGSVYYLYSYSADFLLEGVPVTAYLHDDVTGEYNAVRSTVTDANGEFEFLNLPQGLYIIRATYVYGENTLAGTEGVELDRKDNNNNVVIVNRDAVNDSDYYQYTATGTAFYQTDKTDDSTIHPVPTGSIVLLYKLVDGESDPVYVGMTTTDANGKYAFGGLSSADYIVNVVFNYEGGVYTYDNSDALADKLSFMVSGADVKWPDIIKQVNANTEVNPPVVDPIEPDEPEKEPVPCVVSGNVFYEDNGVHTTDPVEGVDVYVYLKSNNVEVGHTVTDENGYWEIEGLGVADYIAVFSYKGHESRVLVFSITDADYAAGTYEAAPQYFDRLVETPSGTIRGIVLDDNGNSMRALVAIYDRTGELADFAYTDTYGFYEFTVASGYDYNVRILAVEDEVTTLKAGDPDDDLTTLDYYMLSGVFGVDGVPQSGQLIAVYYEVNGEYELVTATLTDENGQFNVKVYDEGNYRVCPYINSEIYEVRDVSVGYQEERPSVTTAINGSYTVSGIESYQDLTLYKISDGVETTVYTETGVNANSYQIENLDAGQYRLKLVNNGKETWYYFTCPEGALVDVTYYVTISGSVLDENGNAIIGANVAVYDSTGKLVGPETTILSDGGYRYSNLIEGEYTVVITSPHTSEVMADKWTWEPDSYDKQYPNGLTAGDTWTWNINANLVSGKVTDQKGAPIEGAYVMFQDVSDVERQYVAITDENGEYQLGLSSGRYATSCVYYWDTTHKFNGVGYAYIDLTGDVHDVDFTVTRHALTVETIRKADETVAPNTDVMVYFTDGTLFWEGKTDENGTVTLDVFPGAYLVRGSYDGVAAVLTTDTIVEDTTVTLRLDSVVYITGTVTDANGNPVSDGLVYYDNGAGNSGHVYTDDTGAYKIPVSSADLGEYELYAAQGVNSGEPVTVTVNGDVTVNLTVSAGAITGETHILSGVVTDEEGNRLANALVTMTWGNDKTNRVTTSTNSDGEYSFEVEDGTYYLAAEYEASNGNSYVSNSEYAVHMNGADVEQNLRVLMRYNVTVSVVDADGNAVSGAKVYFTGAESGVETTGNDGTVVLYLANGDYRFYAKTASRSSKTISVTVNGETPVTLELTNVGIAYEEPDVYPNELMIWGYVYNPDGHAVEGADVKLYKQDFETLEWNLVESKLSDAEGYYEFPGLDDGVYRVDTVYTYTTDAEVKSDGYTVSGTLTDAEGNPLSNNTVQLYSTTGDLIATVVTGEDGYYEFPGLEADVSYRVYAEDATEEPILDTLVTADAGELVIEDVVTDHAGHIVVDAEVIIKDADGNIVATTVTDETGAYKVVVDGVSDSYTTTVTYPASYEIDTDTYQRDTTDRNAPYLTASWYTIEGYVHDNDGNPVEGAIVILKDVTQTEIDRYVTESDGYYIFDGLEDGIYYVEVIYNDTTEHIYEIDAETGNVTDRTPEPVEPTPENINVTITNFAKGSVIEPENGWFEGENTFIVENLTACVVYRIDSYGNRERLQCVALGNDQYAFTADFEEGDEIVVVVRGDTDLNGYVSIADMTRINQYLAGLYTLSDYQKIAADADVNDYVSIADMTRINQYLAGLYSFTWNLAG